MMGRRPRKHGPAVVEKERFVEIHLREAISTTRAKKPKPGYEWVITGPKSFGQYRIQDLMAVERKEKPPKGYEWVRLPEGKGFGIRRKPGVK